MFQVNLKARVLAGLVGLTAFFGAPAADAQSYPTKPIQVIVPLAGGSASDVLMRIVLDRMGNTIGQRFVVENRPAPAAISARWRAPTRSRTDTRW